MDDDLWYCPATDKEIDRGLCWEYCFVDIGGPADSCSYYVPHINGKLGVDSEKVKYVSNNL